MALAALKKEVGDPHFLLLKNNQHVAFKPSANFKKILGSEFRATFIFPKIKVALNPLPRFFFKFELWAAKAKIKGSFHWISCCHGNLLRQDKKNLT